MALKSYWIFDKIQNIYSVQLCENRYQLNFFLEDLNAHWEKIETKQHNFKQKWVRFPFIINIKVMIKLNNERLILWLNNERLIKVCFKNMFYSATRRENLKLQCWINSRIFNYFGNTMFYWLNNDVGLVWWFVRDTCVCSNACKQLMLI